MMKTFLVVFATISSVLADGMDYSYDDQAAWGGSCNEETSVKQSPVDVITPSTKTTVETKFVELTAGSDSLSAENKNVDSTIKISFNTDVKYNIPGLNVEGTVAQLHIHWGADDNTGSEHWLDGKQFAAEAHLVTAYGTEGQYAVVNRFYKVGEESPEMAKLIASAKATGEDRDITGFNLTALYPNDISDVITYEGGLTTPDCDEIVFWVINPEPLTISADQLAELRTVPLGDGTSDALTWNWRSKQALNGRTFTHYKSSATALLISPLLILLTLFCM